MKKNYKIIYVCKNCKGEISFGAIYCPHCRQTDPNVEPIGIIDLNKKEEK